MIAPYQALEKRTRPWREPLDVAAALSRRDGALALLSDGGALGRFSYVAADPDHVEIARYERLDRLDDPALAAGVVALIAYDGGARAATGDRPEIWPDLMLARYPAMLAFDHQARTVTVLGRGEEAELARRAADKADRWLDAPAKPDTAVPPAASFKPEASDGAYLEAVADVVERIARGDLFQANIARAWTGELRPDADPFDVMLRLADRASAYGAFWRLGDRAVASNSPELFLTFDPASGGVQTRPIKGTRPRHRDPAADAALAETLAASAKDRAENLMIVDLMRNDLSRVAQAGSVRVERLFEVETLPTVHHLVSTVTATARAGMTTTDLLAAAFPPGSITGAPKHQAMKVIAELEPPRGAWCGSLLHVGDEGRLTASVLIRTASFEKIGETWRFRTLAGAGIVADSRPEDELAETEVKIRALREALAGDQQSEQATCSTSRGRRK